jgi:phosphoribosylanthranilate isomerase
VSRAIAAANAAAVDVSSGVETAPGVKNPELIQSFIASARAKQFAGVSA